MYMTGVRSLNTSWSRANQTTATLAMEYEGSEQEIKYRMHAVLHGAEKRVKHNSRLSTNRKRKISREYSCLSPDGCWLCRHREHVQRKKEKEAALAAANGGEVTKSSPKKKVKFNHSTGKPYKLYQPRNLQSMCLRSVLKSKAMPSQFESILKPIVSTQVWMHMPMRDISAIRMLRVYGVFHINALSGDDRLTRNSSGSSGCSCATEVWLDSTGCGISRLRINLCASCMGFDRNTLRMLQDCPACKGIFGACGCKRCIHMIIDAYFNEARILRKIELHSNRIGWWDLGSTITVGEGYPHGMLTWDQEIPIQLPADMIKIPNNVAFHAGIFHTGKILEERLVPNHLKQNKNITESNTSSSSPSLEDPNKPPMILQILCPLYPTTRCLDARISRRQFQTLNPLVDGPMSLRFVKEIAVPTFRQLKTGAELFDCIATWISLSFSMGLFVRAARMYMTNALAEQTQRPSPVASRTAIDIMKDCGGRNGSLMIELSKMPPPTSNLYAPIYGISKSTDWPQSN